MVAAVVLVTICVAGVPSHADVKELSCAEGLASKPEDTLVIREIVSCLAIAGKALIVQAEQLRTQASEIASLKKRQEKLENRESIRGMFFMNGNSCLHVNPFTGNCSCNKNYTHRVSMSAAGLAMFYCTRDGGA